MYCRLSRLSGLFTVVWFSCGVPSGHNAISAEELDFRVIGNRTTGSAGHTHTSAHIRPSVAGTAASQPAASPLAPEGFPDFHLIGSPRKPATDVAPSDRERLPQWNAAARQLDFTVLGTLATGEPPKPVVYVYGAPPGMFCHACDQLARHAGQLPYALQWQRAPVWVQSFPTLHWQGANGAWKKWEGWPGPARFQQIYEESQK